jgi:recombination protein RecA
MTATTPISAERQAIIDRAVSELDKAFGKGSIMQMKKAPKIEVATVPTGVYTLDHKVLGVGGFPKGRIIEVYGMEASGKTTTALLAIGSAQQHGGAAALIDTEHAFDPGWATKNGVNVDDLFVSQPDYGEQALQIVERLLETHSFEIIVVDSVAALVPKAELDGEIGDANMGMQARLMSQAMRKLTGLVSKSNTVLLFTNQLREKVGVFFGSPEVTSGGKALKFYASVRLDVRRIGAIKEGDVVIGAKTRIKAVKNKVAAPFRETEIELLFATGVDRLGNLVDAAIDAKIIERSGAWFKYKGVNIGQGRTNTIAYIAENNLAVTLLEQLKEQR